MDSDYDTELLSACTRELGVLGVFHADESSRPERERSTLERLMTWSSRFAEDAEESHTKTPSPLELRMQLRRDIAAYVAHQLCSGPLRARIKRRISALLARQATAANVDDVFSDVLDRFLRRLWHIDSPASAVGYLYRTTDGACLDFHRKYARDKLLFETVLLDCDARNDALSAYEARDECQKSLAILPEQHAEVIRLHCGLGHSHKEIAAMLDSTVDRVKKDLQKGKRKLEELGREHSRDAKKAPQLARRRRRRKS